MAQSRREKLDKQRERQRAVRAARKAERKPSRDDIARMLLHWAITEMLRSGREKELHRVQDAIIGKLAAQGFDRRASEAAFDELIDRYGSGWAFQRKLHLRNDTGDDSRHE